LSKDRVLVTGGAGFIGSHTVDLLLACGYEVRVIDSLQTRVHQDRWPDYMSGDAELIKGDVTKREDLLNALDGVASVVHLAAYQDYQTDFSNFIHTNTESTALLFELIVEELLPVDRIVLASSQSVAGEGRYRCEKHGVITAEPRTVEQLERGDWEIHCPQCGCAMENLLIDESICSPHTTYGISKFAIELLAASLGRRYGIATACMRYTYVQGARNSFYNAYSGICRIFALRILNGLPPICYEDGRQLRDYVNVADVARANLFALERPDIEPAVFNVGGGQAMSVSQFAEVMLDVAGSSLRPSIPGIFRVGDTRHTISDISMLEELGWVPEIPVSRSIREYLEWMAPHRDTLKYLTEAEGTMQAGQVLRQARTA
jgi:dTDP-L-rhamnose 4-epimerase